MKRLRLWFFIAINKFIKVASRFNNIQVTIFTPLYFVVIFGFAFTFLGLGLSPNSPYTISSSFLMEYANNHWFLVNWLISIFNIDNIIRSPNLFYLLIIMILTVSIIPISLINHYIPQNLNKKVNSTIDDLKEELEIKKTAGYIASNLKEESPKNTQKAVKKVMKI